MAVSPVISDYSSGGALNSGLKSSCHYDCYIGTATVSGTRLYWYITMSTSIAAAVRGHVRVYDRYCCFQVDSSYSRSYCLCYYVATAKLESSAARVDSFGRPIYRPPPLPRASTPYSCSSYFTAVPAIDYIID